ncbi:MAG: hypothetical protein K9G76_10425 [Bacteroidales bacterium]|nr:hypothetical protein [Bacteroidales bacterium]MCF8405252.1 hypothetical protein [Bacteroidales bacterium]
MKKLLLITAVFCFVLSGFTQENESKDYKMYELMYIKPRTDKLKELNEALAHHNKTYHNEGPNKVHMWYASTGPHTGDLVWAMGPLTFTDLDSRPESKEHLEDWMYNVMPNVKEVSEGEYWKLNSKLSHSPEGSFSGKEVWTVYDIKPYESYRFTAIIEKVVEVYKKKEYENYFTVFESQFNGNDTRDVAIGFGFKNWAFFDKESTFKKDFEEIHGEGSWFKLMEEYRDVVNSSFEEVSEYMPEISGGSDK